MLAKVLKIFLGKEHLVKHRLISTLDKVFCVKGTFFQQSTKLYKIGWRSAEKIALFINMRLLVLRFLWSID
jgi:hypothetical protein